MNTLIGDRPLSLAGHLRTTAALIENRRMPYNFAYSHTCNVGCLARVVADLDAYTLATELNAYYAPLRSITGGECSWDNWANTARNAIPVSGRLANGIVG